ncbi:helix-turn-helix transcriptional regulator [Microbacterium sp. 179-I 3D3 NHS]|uniref:helix-turn-helix transcriptional regulator n=1 Tax=Microbacterium sp. 179-I 3D3 NHS TaxID=3142382 RepID=UPI0039A3E8FD
MQFTSTDVDVVEATWKRFVPSASLQRVDPQRFRFDWRSAGLGSATLVRYDLAAQIHSTAGSEEQLLVCRVDSPVARVWSHRSAIDPRAPWLTDGAPVQAAWHGSAQVRALVFDRDAAQARVRLMIGDDTAILRSTGTGPVGAAEASRWERMFHYLDTAVGEVAGEGAEDDRMLLSELERHALVMTLSTFPTTLAHALRRPAQRSGAPVTVRRALAYIDENAHLPITVDDVAAAAFISTRGLQYAFRRALDITPAQALRRARLDGARREIENSGSAPVAAVARRWGFTHPSRFVAAYRAAYGAPPAVRTEDARTMTADEESVRY